MDRLACDRMFVAVVETGSFSAAAQRLGTSSGQASKLVARLEGELGVTLLHRTTRALSLTEAGSAYAHRLRTLLEEFDTLDTEVRNAATTPRGQIRLTAPLTFGTLRLAPVLNNFATSYPEISLDVQFTDRLISLVDEGFDAAIRVGKPVDSTLIARKLCEVRLLTVAAPAYLSRRSRPKIPADLAGHDCILDTNTRDLPFWTYRNGEKVAVAGRLAYSNASVCLDAAEAGLGIARIPDFVGTESLIAGRVVELLPEFEDAPFGVHALYPSGRHLSAKVRLLVDHLALALRKSLPSLP